MFQKVVSHLRSHQVDAEVTDYGFRVWHAELKDHAFMECGMDNDSSISLSVKMDESPPVIWFFRKDIMEMADLIVASYNNACGPSSSRAKITAALRERDNDYDDTDLEKMTRAFLGELDDE